MTLVVKERRSSSVMRRIPILITVIAVTLLGLVGLGAQSHVVAQESTPAVEGMPPGIGFEDLAFVTGIDVPSPADLSVSRITLEPGAGFPLEESDPTGGMLVVESGTFTVTASAEMSVSRGAALDSAMATAMAGGAYAPELETVAVGEEATLEAGDAAWVPGGISGEIRNDGSETAVGLAFLISPKGAMMGEATPAP
jgi:quercetin dioxygenase-like cupin family protein